MNGLDITPSTTNVSTNTNVTVISSSISSPSSNSCHVLANSSVHNNSNNSNSSGSSNGQQSIMSTGNLNTGSGGRTKRMRTSFKHHQLRTMKQYFSLNQNPDAKDLKALAQKTNLSKRVLQVSWVPSGSTAVISGFLMNRQPGQALTLLSITITQNYFQWTVTPKTKAAFIHSFTHPIPHSHTCHWLAVLCLSPSTSPHWV